MKILVPILIICVLILSVQAEEIDVDAAYFHPAASLYIHGDMAGASNLVARGLSVFPEDGKLLRLKELLEQQDQQQQDDSQQEQDQQQDQQQDDSQQEQDQQQEQQQEQEPSQQAEQEPPKAEQLSRDEAEQLLDAMRQEEQNKRLQLHPVMGAPVNVEKDW